MTPVRPFEDLRTTGLLWLINTTVFHPRGYALALHFEDDGSVSGWSILGDGEEAWQFGTDEDSVARVDSAFQAVKELLP
jgi:hypothetical protein